MNISEKVKAGVPLTREEFSEIVRKTDWEDYQRRVDARIAKISDIHAEARFRSMAAAHRHVYFSV
jgi:uncharacterized protein YeeX (DUF496 family)